MEVYVKQARGALTKRKISAALKGKPRNPQYHFWTPSEIAILKERYPYANFKELSKELGHPILAVRGKARRLGLTLERPRYTESSWSFVKSNPYEGLFSKEELAYLAGIFDGEGCLNKQSFYWRMDIVNTYKPLLEHLEGKIPYSSTTIHAFNNGNHRTTYQWRLGDNCKVRCLLVLLLPYLKVKLAKAQDAVADIEKWMNISREI